MDVFDLDRTLVRDYEQFARSFPQIRAPDIRSQVDQIYAERKFWPEPLITINPHFERDAAVQELADGGLLHPDTATVFRVGGTPITLHRHQAQATAKAATRQSFVVTSDRRKSAARLYPTFFCRNCGKKHHPVKLTDDGGAPQVIPQPINESPIEDGDGGDEAGYPMPEPKSDPTYSFGCAPRDYPGDWAEAAPSAVPRWPPLELKLKAVDQLVREDGTGDAVDAPRGSED